MSSSRLAAFSPTSTVRKELRSSLSGGTNKAHVEGRRLDLDSGVGGVIEEADALDRPGSRKLHPCHSVLLELRGPRQAQWRQVLPHQCSLPPRPALPAFPPRSESIEVEPRPHEPGWLVREWVAPQQLDRSRVVLEQLDDERNEPWVVERRGHGCEPHQPVESQVVRRDLGWAPPGITWLGLEHILTPGRLGARGSMLGPLDHHFVAIPRH